MAFSSVHGIDASHSMFNQVHGGQYLIFMNHITVEKAKLQGIVSSHRRIFYKSTSDS